MVVGGDVDSVEVARGPTETLKAWERLKLGLFIHFGLSTFTGNEFGRIEAPSTAYAPTGLDVDQWIETAQAAGMHYAVLTVKHHYGHALWPGRHSDYTVATSSDARDVVRLFVDACRKRRVRPGFYYSLGWDRRHMPKMTPDEYLEFALNQVTELLTEYGPITELWFDIPWDCGPDTRGALERLYRHCKSLQPRCLVLLNQGFVDGSQVASTKPTYAGVVASEELVPIWPKDLNNGERVWPREAGHDPWITFEGVRRYIPNEVCDSLGQRRWFWGAEDDVRPARQLVELYRRSVLRGSNLLLNIGPDQNGRLPDEMVARLLEVSRLIKHPHQVRDSLLWGCKATASNVYGGDVASWGPQHAIDMDIGAEGGTRWATDDEVRSAWLEVNLGKPRLMGQATISEHLDSVRAWELQVPDARTGWRTIYRGTRIGGPGVDVRFDPVQSDRIRLSITQATLGPTIWDFAVYAPKGGR